MKIETIRSVIDYVFLLIGAFFLISLGFPGPLMGILQIDNLQGIATMLSRDLIYAPVAMILLGIVYITMRFAFLQDLVKNTVEFVGNLFLTCVGWFVVIVVWTFSSGMLTIPLAEQSLGAFNAALFLALFFIISAARDLSDIDA